MQKQLQFSQPKVTKNRLIITEDDVTVGSLETKGIFRSTTTASMYDHNWRFTKKGLITKEIVVSDDSSGAIVTFHQSPLRQKGSIIIDPTTYTFKKQGLHLKSQYVWQDVNGKTLVTYKIGGIIKKSGTIEVDDSILTLPKLQLLGPLGLFVGIQQEDDDGSTASGSVAAAS